MSVLVDCGNVDWVLLQKQKYNVFKMSSLLTQYRDTLEGILSLLDHLQDEAAEILGDATVFGKSTDVVSKVRVKKKKKL